jgi:hypothetical protein
VSRPVDFLGSNMTLGPPEGTDDLGCATIRTFTNGSHTVVCVEFGDDEVEEIVRTRRVYVSLWSGKTMPPIYVGTEEDVRSVIADVGVWKK